ncbi:MAG: type II toxin-antitoxin system RelE/ParE family toxin [Candidatus Omnitrophica bacterium]|nr:type II toxin-antitoxin system RelE/ParE family toxin [Candidatus Omnitrophota bacterium]
MNYKLRLAPQIQTDVSHFSPVLKKKVKAALKLLQNDPLAGKPLLDELQGFWSYPVAHHRIIYVAEEKIKEIKIIMIAARYEVYELLLQEKLEK